MPKRNTYLSWALISVFFTSVALVAGAGGAPPGGTALDSLMSFILEISEKIGNTTKKQKKSVTKSKKKTNWGGRCREMGCCYLCKQKMALSFSLIAKKQKVSIKYVDLATENIHRNCSMNILYRLGNTLLHFRWNLIALCSSSQIKTAGFEKLYSLYERV